MNNKSQELSLNLIVIGSLALLVLLIVGGILIFGGGDLLSGFTSIGASEQEVTQISFINHCRSLCNTLNLRMDWEQLEDSPELFWKEVKDYCCEHSDLDKSGGLDYYGEKGPEICALAFDCMFDTRLASEFCDGIYFNKLNGYYYSYLFRTITTTDAGEEWRCNYNPPGYSPAGNSPI
ncbi:MAG: hypothetical protein JW791_02805 [Nanoarchaeota archaeon]|nr:hypothetical protein [Nanoarchaeota archaeon]